MNGTFRRALILSALIITVAAGSVAEARTEGKELHHRLMARLLVDAEGASLLGDYLLFFGAKAAYERGDYHDSLANVERFLALYRDTPLYRNARLLKIRTLYAILDGGSLRAEGAGCFETGGVSYPEVIEEMKDYLDEFPSDGEALYLYAKTLKMAGREGEADAVFKSLYLRADRYYTELKERVSDDDLTIEETLLLSRNLRRSLRLKESESLILRRLEKGAGAERGMLYESLADTYFRMKEYDKAALYYLKAGNDHRAAVSFYRAGDYDDFERALARAGTERTEKTCYLLLLKGLQKRRDNEFDEALDVFRTAYREYPCKEKALWHIAWTEYLAGNFLSASYNFRDLYKEYGNPAYIYWQARSLERMGHSARGLYNTIPGDSLYAFMGRMRSGGVRLTSGAFEVRASLEGVTTRPPAAAAAQSRFPSPGRVSPAMLLTLRRAEILRDAGLGDYAVKELTRFRPEGVRERLALCGYLQSLGAYNESFRCAYKAKGAPGAEELLYPVAYGDIVSRISSQFDIDPLVVFSVMREESRFNETAFSRAGALGLMQLMPFTARRMAEELGREAEGLTRDEIMEPLTNITLGGYYLQRLLDEFGAIPLAVAAYNAGESAVRRWLDARAYHEIDEFIEDIPYRETRLYVKKVLRTYFKYADLYGKKN